MAEWLRRQIRNLVGVYPRGFESLCCRNNITKYAWMAEWSKAVDLSSILFVGVGSNPTSGIKFKKQIFFFFSRNSDAGVA